MAVAIKKVHLSNGPWAAEGGYEYNAVLMAAVFAITADGPGALALDRREWGTGWAVAELIAGVAGAAAMLKFADQGASGDVAGDQAGTESAPEPAGTTA
jgi:putative oxidoreductase